MHVLYGADNKRKVYLSIDNQSNVCLFRDFVHLGANLNLKCHTQNKSGNLESYPSKHSVLASFKQEIPTI